MVTEILILNAENVILSNGNFWKPINRRRAIGGGWGGGGPNPPTNHVPPSPYINPRHSKQNFECRQAPPKKYLTSKNQCKKMQARGKTCFSVKNM